MKGLVRMGGALRFLPMMTGGKTPDLFRSLTNNAEIMRRAGGFQFNFSFHFTIKKPVQPFLVFRDGNMSDSAI
jgi:hypothetical protein